MGEPGLLLIRADAGSKIGTGHVMRCLALAQVWTDKGGRAGFLLGGPAAGVQARLGAEGFGVEVLNVEVGSLADALATREVVKSRNASWLVLDGYGFGTDYQRTVRAAGAKLLQLDDYRQSERFEVDVLLNQNLHASPEMYSGAVGPDTELLLGPRYALLRREFWAWRGHVRGHRKTVRRIVVTLGGGDADNVTGRVLAGLDLLGDSVRTVIVIVGGSNPHLSLLEDAAGSSRHDVQLVRNVADMPSFVAEADLAICGGGATCWELAFLGLPMIAIVLADNQRQIAASLDRAGVLRNLGWHATTTPEAVAGAVQQLLAQPSDLSAMSVRGQRLIDGMGADRVVDALVLKGEQNRMATPVSNERLALQ